MNLSDIKARHAHIENQARTQSVELIAERRSKAHADRAWLVAELEAALKAGDTLRESNTELLGQNDRLAGELDVLGSAVEKLKPTPKPKPKKAKAEK